MDHNTVNNIFLRDGNINLEFNMSMVLLKVKVMDQSLWAVHSTD